MLRKGIALGFVDKPHHQVGTGVAIDIRGRTVDAEIVRGPFYPRRSRPSKSGRDRLFGAERP
jgi:glycine cleavage system aminomethyltransferase T